MSLSIDNVVRVTLQQNPLGAKRKSFGTIGLFTPEQGTCFNNEKTRYVYVNSIQEVQAMFGTESQTAKCASIHFMQEPRAQQLIIYRWQKDGATIPESKNQLKGATLNNTLQSFKNITKGAFAFTVAGEIKQVTGLDFSDASGFNSIADKITTEITDLNLTATYDNIAHRIIIASTVGGEDKATEIGYMFADSTEGDYVGSMLKLENGQAEIFKGANEVQLKPETVAQALFKAEEANNTFYGFTFAAQLTDEEIEQATEFAMTSQKLFALSVIKKSQIEWDNSNVLKKLYDKTSTRVLPVFDNDDMYQAISALSILLSVNYSAQRSMITLKFKKLPGISADDISLTEHTKAKRLGINTFTYYDDVAMLAEGTTLTGRWADEIVGLDWFKDAVQKEVFNVFIKNKLVPYTDEGNAMLATAVKKVCYEALNNGFIAPGEWTKRGFGELNEGDWLDEGFYVWSAPMRTANSDDRQSRRPTPIQVAIKLAGAIHYSDVMIEFDR